MLSLKNISKQYKVADNVVNALKEINLSFRRNEFVSILGPSGSGKTTLLNIIGGLDKYSDGDLFIAGKSTKEFKDRDWDFYRNQRIGFIFQSYNLIPHQTVLSNVELALTISGVNKEERKLRAKEALDKVGLSDQYDKKPNQLSGGQCQRVAIARALVNNPEILLADEPTGALDTVTSGQIMDLIKEIAKDRLVIMVTHNPELANKYSTRIINLRDGLVEKDSNPYSFDDELKEVDTLSEEEINKKSKAKMSFPTAVKLSFKNLLSKRKRSILVSVASSIGIIGISTVLAVSCGVTDYINGMQDDMLSSYPISISEESVDYTSLLGGLTSSGDSKVADFDISTQVGVQSMINYLMEKYGDITSVRTNEINHNLMSFIEDMDKVNLSAMRYDYGIDVTNNLFCQWQLDKDSDVEYTSLNGLTQKYIAELKTVDGFSQYASYVDLFTNFMKQMPEGVDGDEKYILNQYDLLGNSKFASQEDEIMLVVDNNTTLTDLNLAQLGFYKQDEFLNIAKRAIKEQEARKLYDNKEITKDEYLALLDEIKRTYYYPTSFNYTDIIGKELYYFPHETLWEYGAPYYLEYDLTTAVCRTNDNNQILSLTYDENSKYLTGSYIQISPFDTKTIYLQKYQDTGTPGVLDGIWVGLFGDTSHYCGLMITTINGMTFANFTTNPLDPNPTLIPMNINVTTEHKIEEPKAYMYNAKAKDEWINNPSLYKGMKVKIAGILRPKDSTKFGSLSRGVYYNKKFTDRYMNDAMSENNKLVNDPLTGFKAYFGSSAQKETSYKAYVTFSYSDFSLTDEGILRYDGYANALNGDLSSSVSSLFSSLTGGENALDVDIVHFRAVTGYKPIQNSILISSFNFEKLPQKIEIYPKDFSAKDKVTNYLKIWNSQDDITVKGTTILRKDRKDVTYTDTVEMIVLVVNTLITTVTSALIAFTSLSLVVSCFMIAVITYISVMERVKEIGVIRSLGGRKKDVSRLFTAENLMTGLASGIIGIIITYLLSLIINVSVHVFAIPSVAALPFWLALVMIALSIVLNVLSGVIPSRNASRQDPVNALRSE